MRIVLIEQDHPQSQRFILWLNFGDLPNLWRRYRDWVIGKPYDDRPYDHFFEEQIAGFELRE